MPSELLLLNTANCLSLGIESDASQHDGPEGVTMVAGRAKVYHVCMSGKKYWIREVWQKFIMSA